jgi:hypothetical protein
MTQKALKNVHLNSADRTVKIRVHRKPRQGGYMLVLTRRITESLMIGRDITVTVLGVKGKQVRIGIDAPSS